MSYNIAPLSFKRLGSLWPETGRNLRWASVFVLPHWLEAWWQEFGGEAKQHLCAVEESGNVIGIAPLMVENGRASFIGSADVCDYLDFIVAPGKEKAFFIRLLEDLRYKGIRELYLESLRPDSAAYTHLVELAKKQGGTVICNLHGVSLDLELPSSWEEYLEMLTPKQRRELGRKLRRLYEAGEIGYDIIEDREGVRDAMDIFFKLLRDSRKDKATFMTAGMESFFRSIADTMAGAGLLRLGILRVSSLPVASVMCFDYNEKVYLYNSGYDPLYSYLSVGLLSKALSIKDSIERGRKIYDFLKGAEEYKYRLGGREIPIYHCRIVLNNEDYINQHIATITGRLDS